MGMMSRVELYRQVYQAFPTSHGCEPVTTGVIFHRSVCFSFFERLLSQTVGEAPQAWARPSSKPNPIPDLVMWLFGPWVLHYPQISPGQATRSISGGTDVWLSQKQWWMLPKLFFGQLVGWVLESKFHALIFTALRLWLWQCGGEKCSQSVAKQRSWSRLSCWAVPGLCCVFVLRNTAKKNQTSEASLQTYDSKLFSMNTLNTQRKSTLTCKLGSILPTGPQYELVADVWSMRMKVSTQHKQQQWLHLCQQKKTMATYSAPRLNWHGLNKTWPALSENSPSITTYF